MVATILCSGMGASAAAARRSPLARQTLRPAPASSRFLAGSSLRSAVSNRTQAKAAAFFNFGKKNNDYSECHSAFICQNLTFTPPPPLTIPAISTSTTHRQPHQGTSHCPYCTASTDMGFSM